MTVEQLIECLREFPDWYEVGVERRAEGFGAHCVACSDDECEGVGDVDIEHDTPAPRREGIGTVLL